jgi:hypothetical protein
MVVSPHLNDNGIDVIIDGGIIEYYPAKSNDKVSRLIWSTETECKIFSLDRQLTLAADIALLHLGSTTKHVFGEVCVNMLMGELEGEA